MNLKDMSDGLCLHEDHDSTALCVLYAYICIENEMMSQ